MSEGFGNVNDIIGEIQRHLNPIGTLVTCETKHATVR